MSYQVLARKWRPRVFAELVGQEHVVNAICNGLTNNRLHHAYLFSGTRGVGKTTIARIFSKSLNCEKQIGANPCGQCDTCMDIEQGRYVDLLEIDAASRTKVEDTRELLDNVQYKPTRGRYKVYLIDEVHMLSKHSFNALLKTLEEPPEHVKFLLATTDPQKLPITVLSRCLQFNLKALSREQILQQLVHILSQEQIDYNEAALQPIAKAAQGSMRDALSLTDQAIAQSNGNVTPEVVTQMLGLLNKQKIFGLFQGIVQSNPKLVFQKLNEIEMQGADFAQVLKELMSLLHQIALTQFVPDVAYIETDIADEIHECAKSIEPEFIQLLYQIAIQGNKELAYAADAKSGLEMILLRMLAFNPVTKQRTIPEIAQLSSQPEAGSSAGSDSQGAQKQQELVTQQEQILTQAAELQSQPVQKKTLENDVLNDEQINYINSEPPTLALTETHAGIEEINKEDGTELEAIVREDELSNREYEELNNLPANLLTQVEDIQGYEQRSVSPSLDMLEALPADTQNGNSGNLSAFEQSKELLSLHQQLREESESIQNKDETQTDVKVAREPVNLPHVQSLLDTPVESPVSLINEDEPTVEEGISQDSSPLESEFISSHSSISSTDDTVPAFLEDGTKVTKSAQLDPWSHMVDRMDITGLSRQLALNAIYSLDGNDVLLRLDKEQHHLNTSAAIAQVSGELSKLLQQNIQIEVVLDEVVDTPINIQRKIDISRTEFAKKQIAEDKSILSLQEMFDASYDHQSVTFR